MSILECRSLYKNYGNKRVLENMNISVPAGKIIGLLGPNGCGKSTLIKMICGLLVPSSGEIWVDGMPIGPQTNGIISYLPERTYLSNGMKVIDLIDYFCDFYRDFDRKRAMKMLQDLMIDPASRLRTLSKGTREKVQLIMVMARNAKLYLLDEPIAGVDPASRDYILQTILQNYNPEATVIITTHLIHDIERILDEFVFLGFGGEIVMGGNADDIRGQYGKTLDELFREVFKYVQ
ncbi:MAG: ABC transporter ATP-binding protein [Clostridia bacterium]|nr:ABC transporter ATP-binding protein [Clostridia bacterium]